MKHSNNNEKYFFEINKDEDNLFYFQLKDKNGKIYLESPPYTRKTDCQKELKSVLRNSKNEFRIELVPFSNNEWCSILKTGNGRAIAMYPFFETKEELESFIKDLKSLSLETLVIDKTE